MPPLFHSLAQNTTSTPPSFLVNPPFSAPIQVALFFVGVCVVHAMTAYVPIPDSSEDRWGRILSMIIGPVGAGASPFHSIVVFAVKICRGKYGTAPHTMQYQQAQLRYGFQDDLLVQSRTLRSGGGN